MLPFIFWVTSTQYWLVASISISFPFILASIARQFLIDWVYQKYNVNISPVHLFELVVRHFKK
jgi:hypothetical protein